MDCNNYEVSADVKGNDDKRHEITDCRHTRAKRSVRPIPSRTRRGICKHSRRPTSKVTNNDKGPGLTTTCVNKNSANSKLFWILNYYYCLSVFVVVLHQLTFYLLNFYNAYLISGCSMNSCWT